MMAHVHPRGRTCEETDEMVESYRRRAIRAEQQLLHARQVIRARVVHFGNSVTEPTDVARVQELGILLRELSGDGRREPVATYSDPIGGRRGVLLDQT